MAAPQLLMPKATAVWLVENTTLTFDQIGAFCNLHPLEVQGIADGEVAIGIVGLDPTTNGQLTKEEIERCEKDSAERLKMAKVAIPLPLTRSKGPRYTPVSKRQDKPDAVAWLVRHHPELTDAQISRLIGTTKQTIAAVRDRSHWNSANLRPRAPVLLGLNTAGSFFGMSAAGLIGAVAIPIVGAHHLGFVGAGLAVVAFIIAELATMRIVAAEGCRAASCSAPA